MSMSRIDKFLISEDMIDRWDIVGQNIGSMDISNHCPIWIVSNYKD